MASFMDNEAVESDDDDISDDEERARFENLIIIWLGAIQRTGWH